MRLLGETFGTSFVPEVGSVTNASVHRIRKAVLMQCLKRLAGPVGVHDFSAFTAPRVLRDTAPNGISTPVGIFH